MVDTIDLLFFEDFVDRFVQRDSGGQVSAKRLFDDATRPTGAFRFGRNQSVLSQPFDDVRVKTWRRCEIVEIVSSLISCFFESPSTALSGFDSLPEHGNPR